MTCSVVPSSHSPLPTSAFDPASKPSKSHVISPLQSSGFNQTSSRKQHQPTKSPPPGLHGSEARTLLPYPKTTKTTTTGSLCAVAGLSISISKGSAMDSLLEHRRPSVRVKSQPARFSKFATAPLIPLLQVMPFQAGRFGQHRNRSPRALTAMRKILRW